MAQIANTVKAFNFALEINGLRQMLVQTFEPPTIEIGVTEHGDVNYKVKTPGLITTGDATLEKIRPADGADSWAWDWFNAGQDPFVGGGTLAGNLKRVIVLRELDPSGTIALCSWIMEGCWISKYAPTKYDRMSEDNILETLTISVDRCRKLN